MPLMVPFVPTGMNTGVRTDPCGRSNVAALARITVVSLHIVKVNAGRDDDDAAIEYLCTN